MNIGLFGGTFDPIHRGHLALARAASEGYKLGRILFVPASIPPHKQSQPLSAYAHRYAMTVLATAQERDFVPSLLEAPAEIDSGEKQNKEKRNKKDNDPAARPNYTIETVRRLKKKFKKVDRLFLLIGIDAFLDIGKWHESEALFRECEFVVASRPGYSLADVANALPVSLRPRAEATRPFQKQAAHGDLMLNGVAIHLLDQVYQPISSTTIRQAAAAGKPLGRFVEPAVADYIKKIGLYKAHFPQP
ncbi:MAG: nicotinate (nicotinamide) nucleotide adenylyltransferase [Candidatus Sulfotelmatobacter sp.]